MEKIKRPLDGVKVVEMGTFIAVPGCARYLADQGADVIKVESARGDNIRAPGTAVNEGRVADPYENTSFDLENSNKRGIVLNTRTPEGKEVLFKLLEKADVFLTNWRPQALEKAGFDYDSLKKRFPRLVYGNVTGYGETGPDKDLPGYDYTAFFARSGISGSLYQKGGLPFNIIPGLGDHQAGMFLAAGVLAALYRQQKSGQGEKVSVNLMHSGIYTQGIMIQAANYKDIGLKYPIDRHQNPNPWTLSYETSDGRLIQFCMPVYNDYYDRLMQALGRDDLRNDPVYSDPVKLDKSGRSAELVDITAEAMKKRPLKEWIERLTRYDIPFALAQVWDEVLEDKQAWAVNCFYKLKYDNGAERIMVRYPVDMEETPLPETKRAPWLGEHSVEILKSLGYSDAKIKEFMEKGISAVDPKAQALSKA
jgi:cinnamoyl-CoA:phenyllactate CoA-transferase